VRGEVIGRSLVLGLLLGAAGVTAIAAAADRCAECVTAGAASETLRVPPGTPLAGYGAMKRRLLFPDVFDRYAHAFWFKPSLGERDRLVTRALVLEAGATRLAWVALDLIAVDGTFVQAVQDRLARAGVPAAALVVSASHTHSGPGAFMDSAVMGFVAVDRLDAEVRDVLVASAVSAIRQADRARAPALAAATSVSAPAVTASRLGKPLDPEIVVLKLTTLSGSPLALVWNFAIHGTMLSASNRRLSGDVMGVASARLEQKLGVPALFVNGAVGDVSPARHGEAAMVETAAALAAAVEAGWTQARPVPVTTLQVAERRVRLPAAAVSLERCLGSWVPGFFAVPLGSAMPRAVSLVAAALGDTAWVTFPGELQTALGQTIKREAHARFASVVVAGVSNDYLGYFTSRADARSGKYVACATVYGPPVGRCLTEAAIDALRGLRPESGAAPRTASTCDPGTESR
jgi:neutral ceramidase